MQTGHEPSNPPILELLVWLGWLIRRSRKRIVAGIHVHFLDSIIVWCKNGKIYKNDNGEEEEEKRKGEMVIELVLL